MRLSDITDELRAAGKKALVPFLTAGYPDPATFRDLVAATADAGCRVLEIGVPFSDPVADGPVIQAASQQALAGGMTLRHALDLAADAGQRHDLAVVLMGYVNPILRLGEENFAGAAREAGVVGAIVPDLPLEESAGLRGILADAGIALVDLVAPTSEDERLARIAGPAEGFVYLVSMTGVTGSREVDGAEVAGFVERVRIHTRRPLYVGFGVASGEQAAAIGAVADGVIVGSALIRAVQESLDERGGVRSVAALLGELQTGLREAAGGNGTGPVDAPSENVEKKTAGDVAGNTTEGRSPR